MKTKKRKKWIRRRRPRHLNSNGKTPRGFFMTALCLAIMTEQSAPSTGDVFRILEERIPGSLDMPGGRVRQIEHVSAGLATSERGGYTTRQKILKDGHVTYLHSLTPKGREWAMTNAKKYDWGEIASSAYKRRLKTAQKASPPLDTSNAADEILDLDGVGGRLMTELNRRLYALQEKENEIESELKMLDERVGELESQRVEIERLRQQVSDAREKVEGIAVLLDAIEPIPVQAAAK